MFLGAALYLIRHFDKGRCLAGEYKHGWLFTENTPHTTIIRAKMTFGFIFNLELRRIKRLCFIDWHLDKSRYKEYV